jgi:type II secretory pathway component GspD/PulD (secretin)
MLFRTVGPRLAGMMAVAWFLVPAAVTAAPGDEKPSKAETPAEKVRKALDQRMDMELENQSLSGAVNQLREQTGVNFVIDRWTIQNMGIDPDQTTVNVKLKEVKLRTGLRAALGQYNLSYAILGDAVLITTEDMAMYRQMRQHVNVEVEGVPMAQAVKQLAAQTGTNLLLDTRVAKEAQATVTLQLEDVPLETAVRLMAEMAGLKPVRIGNVLFVTSKQNANELRQDPDLANPNGNPGIYNPVMPGGWPGMMFPGGMGGVLPMVAPAVVPPPPPVVDPAVPSDVPPESPDVEKKPVEDKPPPPPDDKPPPKQ